MRRRRAFLAVAVLLMHACGTESPDTCSLVAQLTERNDASDSETRIFLANLTTCARFLRVNTGDADVEITTRWNTQRLKFASFELAGVKLSPSQFDSTRFTVRLPIDDERKGARLQLVAPPNTDGGDWPAEIRAVMHAP